MPQLKSVACFHLQWIGLKARLTDDFRPRTRLRTRSRICIYIPTVFDCQVQQMNFMMLYPCGAGFVEVCYCNESSTHAVRGTGAEMILMSLEACRAKDFERRGL